MSSSNYLGKLFVCVCVCNMQEVFISRPCVFWWMWNGNHILTTFPPSNSKALALKQETVPQRGQYSHLESIKKNSSLKYGCRACLIFWGTLNSSGWRAQEPGHQVQGTIFSKCPHLITHVCCLGSSDFFLPSFSVHQGNSSADTACLSVHLTMGSLLLPPSPDGSPSRVPSFSQSHYRRKHAGLRSGRFWTWIFSWPPTRWLNLGKLCRVS